MDNQYIVERKEGREWIAVCRYSEEDADVFKQIASADQYEYRILHNGKNVTKKFRNGGKR